MSFFFCALERENVNTWSYFGALSGSETTSSDWN